MHQSVGARKFKTNQPVTATVSRKVCGDAEPRGGVRIAVKQRRLVEECAARPRRRSAEEDSQVDADSSSDAEVIDAVLGAGKVVDTDDERSAGSLDSSSSSGDDPFIDKYITPKPPAPQPPAAEHPRALQPRAPPKRDAQGSSLYGPTRTSLFGATPRSTSCERWRGIAGASRCLREWGQPTSPGSSPLGITVRGAMTPCALCSWCARGRCGGLARAVGRTRSAAEPATSESKRSSWSGTSGPCTPSA